MKSFLQTIQEESVESKLDKLGHGKLDPKRLKQLKKDYSEFKYFDIEDWQQFPYPKNSSEKTKKEIQFLISLGQFRTDWQNEMIMYDLKVIKPFKDYLDEYGIEIDFTRIKELKEQSDPIILSLKRHYDRPRPKALAKELGLPLDNFPLKTAGTPSYPSGHATQGRLISLLVADEVPLEHRHGILEIGKRIGESRQIAGAHYPSDTAFGIRLGEALYNYSKSSMEPDLTLEMVESLEYSNQDEIEFAVDVVAEIDKQISSINGDVMVDERKGRTNTKKIGIQIILKDNERVKFTTLARSAIRGDDDLELTDPAPARVTKDFAFFHKGIDRKIYVTTRPDGKRGGGAKADPNELMTAALCTMNSIPTVETIEDLDLLIEQVKKIVKGGKVIGHSDLEVQALENDYDNLLMAISAAEVVAKNGWKGADKVYLTGKAWDDDVKQFQVTKYGMKDFNASDYIIKKGDNFVGISLKKKPSGNTGDPTLINKGFTTLLQGEEFDKVREDLDEASGVFYIKLVKTAQRFQKRKPKLAVDKVGNSWLSNRMINDLGPRGAGINKTNWKKFVQGLPNDLINYQLKKSRSLFKPMADVIIDNADLFADQLIQLILKTDLKDLQKVNFDFALVTGIGRMLKRGLVIEKGEYKSVDVMATKLDELVKTGKPNMKLNSRKTQAFDKGSNAAQLHMNLNIGTTSICDVQLRYKGNFASAPSFLATFSKEFKESLK